ncbi:MAG: glycosyltransferase family 39 protein [Planctomycetota bacterium]
MNAAEVAPGSPSERDPDTSWYRDVLVWVVFAIALAVRVAVVVDYEAHHPLAEHPVIDEASYERWALRIADGDWLGDEVFFQEPLYPYWLATVFTVLGPDRTGVRLVQAFLGAVTCVLLVALGRRTFGRFAGLAAGFALAVHPTHALMACLLLKPNLFVPIWVAAACLVVGRTDGRERWKRRALGVGLLAGLGALLRGNALVLLPVVAIWPVVARRFRWPNAPVPALRSTLLVVVGAACVLLPTGLRNWYVGDVFTLTTSGAGTNLYGGNNASNPYGIATEFDWVRGIPEYEAGDWRNEAERRLGRSLDPGEVSSFWAGEVWRSVRRDPLLHVAILWNKLRATLGSYEVPDNHDFAWDERYVTTLHLLPPGQALVGWLALAGFLLHPFSARRERRGIALWWFDLAYLGTIVLTVTSMRARLPLVVVMLPFAGWYVAQWARAERRTLHLVGAAVAAGLLVWVPVFDAAERAQRLAGRDFNLAVYDARSGDPVRLEEARRIAGELERDYPGTDRVLTLRAELDTRLAFELFEEDPVGNRERCEELLGGVLATLRGIVESERTSPRERFRANAVAGHALALLGNHGSAIRRFRDCLEFDPNDRELRSALAKELYLAALDERGRTGGDPRAPALEAAALLEGLLRDAGSAERPALEANLSRVRTLLTQ